MDPISEQENHRKALALIICLFIGFMYWESVWNPYFNPTQPQPVQTTEVTRPQPAPTPSGQEFVEPVPGPSADIAAAGSKTPTVYPSDARLNEQGYVEVVTEDLTVHISLLGGRFAKVYLNEFKETAEEDSPPLNLVTHVEHAPYPLGVYSGNVNDSWTRYQVVGGEANLERINVLAGDARKLVLSGELPDGRGVTKTFTFNPQGYAIGVDVKLSEPSPDAGRPAIEWAQLSDEEGGGLLDPYNVAGFTWFDGERALREAYGKIEEPRRDLGNVRWVAQGNKYFMAALLTPDELLPGSIVKTGNVWRSRLAGVSTTEAGMQLVLGPKDYSRLDDMGYELKRVIDFGYTGFIAAPLLMLLHVLYGLVQNYGLAIVVLTILVRLALYPLAAASFKQMRAMQDLKPEIDRIREQVTDKQQQQMELMGLYKKRGVNPLGGCLPVLLQMPIFIGLYSALMLSVELRHAPFALWINDLSAPEKLMIGGFGIPVMVILFVLSMMAQQWTTPSTMDPAQKKVMLVMPIVFGFMFASFPAGLTLYWLTSNIISIGQQKAMYKSDTPGKTALMVTFAVSVAVFAFAFILTLF